MTSSLSCVDTHTTLSNLWVQILEEQLRDELASCSIGHCLRLTDLPRRILERLADRLTVLALPSVETYLVDKTEGPESWRVGVHKVVERRNAGKGIVVALFPPDLQLAAGDSVDINTFRSVPTDHLNGRIETVLLEMLPEAVRTGAWSVMEYLKHTKYKPSASARLAYLATIAGQVEMDSAAVGGSLFALGLIPDFALMDRPDEISYRLGQRNIAAVERLTDPGATAIERVLRIPLANSDEGARFRDSLMTFFRRNEPAAVSTWGEVVATDVSHRSLALENWPMGEPPTPGELRIDVDALRLPLRQDDDFKIFQRSAKLTLSWQTAPKPPDVPGLEFFRVQIVSADRIVVWESPMIKRGTSPRPVRSRLVKGDDLTGLESGVYFVRVIALSAEGDPFPPQALRDPDNETGKRTNESEDFLLLEDESVQEQGDVEPITNVVVAGYADAELQARWAAVESDRNCETTRLQSIEWLTSADARGETASATIRFDLQRQYTARFSQRLRRCEIAILATPSAGSHYELLLDHHPEAPTTHAIPLPPEFAAARSRVLAGIADQLPGAGESVVALADLCSLSKDIETYVSTYISWLQSGELDALRLDTLSVQVPEGGEAVLVSPTHPVRLLWMLQEQALARSWVRTAAARKEPNREFIETWRRQISSTGIPASWVMQNSSGFLDAGPLPGGWGLYLPAHCKDSRALLSLVRARLGAGAAHTSEADLPPSMLADKLEMFLRQHPYTPSLVLNVVNPGDGALIVDALVELENRIQDSPSDVRFNVRLFSEATYRDSVGTAFRDLLDPEHSISEAADRLIRPGKSFLFPKLQWSRTSLSEFRQSPENFPAHITILLDPFFTELRVVRRDPDDRSSFVHGLVQESHRRFLGKGRSFRWIRRPAPAPCLDLYEAPERSHLLADVLTAVGELQARALAPNAKHAGMTAAASLDLDLAGQSLLYSAHSVSTWVLTVDAHLGLDYFDTASSSDRAGYLLDFAPEFVAAGGRQLLLTTKVDDEVSHLMSPAALRLDLDPQGPASPLLIEALRSLSGRLALKLLSSPKQVQGALGMALSRFFLGSYSLLDQAIAIPLDAHPELTSRDDGSPQLRGDLLVVSAEPDRRHLDFLLIEVKCHSGSGIDAQLRAGIAAQLNSSEAALRQRFDPTLQDPDRVDRSVQSWRLSSVLDFYLERAGRYGLVDESVFPILREFFQSLEAGYSLTVRKTGLVFRLEAEGTCLDTIEPEVPIWVVGKDEIDRIVASALQDFSVRDEQAVEAEEPAVRREEWRTTEDHWTWPQVQRLFGGPKPARVSEATGSRAVSECFQVDDAAADIRPVPPATPVDAGPEDAVRQDDEQTELGQMAQTPQEPQPPDLGPSANYESAESTALAYDILIGDNKATAQFGLLANPTATPWERIALDLNGCNTISVFGVQGSGKSYSVGTIIEMAARSLPGLNVLPKPLGCVVFHYHQTQDYPPEFATMDEPNDDPEQVSLLREMGAQPAGLDDLLILTTSDTAEMRRQEFPRATVEPITFASSELTVADWRFLMGATGNDALYLKLVNEIMRKCRDNLTLSAVRTGIQNAPLNDSHRTLAETRLEFAARFIDDERPLRSLFRPGRLVVVDLRDEFIEKEQALGLFVTMLNVFSGAGLGEQQFNKLIVFDEAHKYMNGPLIGHVVEVIREMRHKGVTAVIASQDPVNVPPSIIELSSVVLVHRFNSPNWLKHIQKSLAALSDLSPSMLASLQPGEAFLWANKSTDVTYTRRAVKIRLRPRATKHGGSTRTAL